MSESNTPNLETKLEALYSAITPDPAFAERLERQILLQAKDLPPSHRANKFADTKENKENNESRNLGVPSWMERTKEGLWRRPVLAWGLALAVVLVLVIGLAGPQRVVAEVQRLLGFAPGVGFVQPGETRLLAVPVVVRQGEVTVRIDSLVADSQQTQVNLTASGLPHEKFNPETGPETVKAQAYLLLPDSKRVKPIGTASGVGDILQASLSFPALPAGVDRVTLVLPRLPSLPAGFAPENWSIPLILKSTAVTRSPQETVLPLVQSYTPSNAEISDKGVMLRLLQVAQGQQETGLQLQINWDDPSWVDLWAASASLADDAGQTYERRMPFSGLGFEPGSEAAPGSRTLVLRFAPLDPQARRAAFTIDQLSFSLKNQDSFTFNPGPVVQPGQTWELANLPGSQLEISGVPVHILQATLTRSPQNEPSQQNSNDPSVMPDPYQLSLLLQTTPQNGLALQSLSLSLNQDRLMSGSMEGLPGNQLRLTIDLPSIPDRPLTLYFPRGELVISGPWKLEWELP